MRIALVCRVSLAVLLGLGLTGAASAAGPAGKECPDDSSYESRAVQLAKCNGGFGDLQRLAGVYQRELGLPAGTASRLAGIIAAQQALETRGDPEKADAEPEIRRIESEFIALVNQAPDDPGIADEASWFYSRWSSNTWRPAPALLDLVGRAADPVTLAFRLTRRISSTAGTEILFAALAVRPDSAALWHQAAQLTYDPAWKIAFLEEAHRLAWPPVRTSGCRRWPKSCSRRSSRPGWSHGRSRPSRAWRRRFVRGSSGAPQARSRRGSTGNPSRATRATSGFPWPRPISWPAMRGRRPGCSRRARRRPPPRPRGTPTPKPARSNGGSSRAGSIPRRTIRSIS